MSSKEPVGSIAELLVSDLEIAGQKAYEYFPLPENAEEDSDILANFNLQDAWDYILNIPECSQIMIGEKAQKQIGAAVGSNVSQEFPWKQIEIKVLNKYLFEEIENGIELQALFASFKPNDLVLLGYVPTLTQDDIIADERDPFIIFTTQEAAYTAARVIKNIEIYEKWLINRSISKKPKYWIGHGSEDEVNAALPCKRTLPYEIEIQSVYPLTTKEYNYRNADSIRDGYVELIPKPGKPIENIYRKRIHRGVQSSPLKVELEQQTHPPFPRNAWSQYLFEITDNDDGLDVTTEEEDEPIAKDKKGQPPPPKPPKPPLLISPAVENLMSTLEFNQVDMYRNDYPHISNINVPRFTNPFLEEMLCFADMSKSLGRYVNGIDWYPTKSGVLAMSYTNSTSGTSVNIHEQPNYGETLIVKPYIALIWSLTDSLNFKLALETYRGIMCLSFCPYQPNLLLGGSYSGQVSLWDMGNRIDNLDTDEFLSTNQIKYRTHMSTFLTWSQHVDESTLILPALVSSLENSQNGAITTIKWLPQNLYVTLDGKMHESKKGKLNRFFITSSTDGTIAFWNLDISYEKKLAPAGQPKPPLPPQLEAAASSFQKLDRIFRPVFMVSLSEPISAFIYSGASFTYAPYGYPDNLKDFSTSYPIKLKTVLKPFEKKKGKEEPKAEEQISDFPEIDKEKILISATHLGNIVRYTWDGFDVDPGDVVNKEKTNIVNYFANIHNGSIITMDQNPFITEIFASGGRNIFAIWHQDFLYTPLLWRKRPRDISNVRWSTDRPAVMFVTRIDGFFEIWDFLARDDQPCLMDVLGGGIVTTLSEHRPSIPKKVFGIGDYNGSFRIYVMPSSFQTILPNEKENFHAFLRKELNRKRFIRQWETAWRNNNQDIIEARTATQPTAAQDLEKLKEEKKEPEFIIKAKGETKKLTTEEKMAKHWDDLNLKRVMEALMARKMVNTETLEVDTALEKENIQYERSKRTAIKKGGKKVDEDLAEIRARLLPAEKITQELDFIVESVQAIVNEAEKFDVVSNDCRNQILNLPIQANIPYQEFFERGIQRRKLINKSLGGNTARIEFYNQMEFTVPSEIDCGYTAFLATRIELPKDEKIEEDVYMEIEELDEEPVKDE